MCAPISSALCRSDSTVQRHFLLRLVQCRTHGIPLAFFIGRDIERLVQPSGKSCLIVVILFSIFIRASAQCYRFLHQLPGFLLQRTLCQHALLTLVSQVQLLRTLFPIAFTRLLVLQDDQPRI